MDHPSTQAAPTPTPTSFTVDVYVRDSSMSRHGEVVAEVMIGPVSVWVGWVPLQNAADHAIAAWTNKW